MYQPSIKTGRPMTALIREAVDEYLVNQGQRSEVIRDVRKYNGGNRKLVKRVNKLLKFIKEMQR